MKPKFCCFLIVSLFISIPAKSLAYASTDSIDLLMKEYKYEKALVIINRLIPENILSKDLYIIKGRALKGLFNYSKAIDSYLAALSLDSLDNQILVELATTYQQIPDYSNSLKYFQLALLNDSTNKLLQIECANCKYYLDAYKDAIADFNKIYRNDTSNYFVIKRLSWSHSKVNQIDTAIYYYKKAIQLNPHDANNVINICNLLILQKKYREGILISEDYLTLDSTNNGVNSQNAYLHLLDKNYDLAIPRFKNCIQHHDTSKFVHKNIGVAYFRLGGINNYDTAKYYFEKAYNMDTTDINTLHFLGLSCSQSYYKDKGVYYLEKAAQQYTTFINEYGTIYRNLVEACRTWTKCPCEKTLSVGIKAYELNPKDSLLIYFIASAYDNCKKDKEKAIEYFKKFLSTKPTKDDGNIAIEYAFAERRLKELSGN